MSARKVCFCNVVKWVANASENFEDYIQNFKLNLYVLIFTGKILLYLSIFLPNSLSADIFSMYERLRLPDLET